MFIKQQLRIGKSRRVALRERISWTREAQSQARPSAETLFLT
jgi:hypothetical protein